SGWTHSRWKRRLQDSLGPSGRSEDRVFTQHRFSAPLCAADDLWPSGARQRDDRLVSNPQPRRFPQPAEKTPSLTFKQNALWSALSALRWSAPVRAAVKRQQRLLITIADQAFDLAHGTSTASQVAAIDLDGIGDHRASAVKYQPVVRSHFEKIIAAIPAPLDGTFVDIGCGKGK